MFTTYSAYTRADQKTVVINPGHSLGYDSGANGTVKCEAQVNQELAGRVVRILNSKGYRVFITHTTDTELAPQKLLSQADGSYLRTVGQAVNNIHPDLCMSIHHNSGGSSASGYELYWSSYRSFDGDGVYEVPGLWSSGSNAYRDSSPCGVAVASRDFAEVVRRHMEGIPRLSYRFTRERDDYLPAHVDAPCILYEGGYLSNPSESAYLASDAYQSEASQRIADAIDEYLGGSKPDVENPVIHSVSTSATETSAMDFSVEANVSDDVAVGSVRFATWTEINGQDDLIWQEGTNLGNGNYSAIISSKDHNYETGVYITHVYAYDRAGHFVGVEAPNVTLGPVQGLPTGLSIEKLTSNIAVAYANNLGGDGYNFAVWSEKGGQDDLVWSAGERQIGSCFRSVINRGDHNNDSGKYFVHCYTPTNQFVGANEIDFGQVEFSSVKTSLAGSQLQASVEDLKTPDPFQKVLFAVWSEEGGQDDLQWYEASGNGNNYSITKDLNTHGGYGHYNVHIYFQDIYGNMQWIDAATVDYNSQSGSTTPTQNQTEGTPTVTLSEIQGNSFTVDIINVPNGYSVLTPTWSEVNGQDDLVWYETNNLGNGHHQISISAANHRGSGIYNVHVYFRDSNGALQLYQELTINVPESATVTTVTVDTPIMGVTSRSAQQLANMYTEHSPISFPDYYIARGVSLVQFAQMYIEEGAAENVRADIAFSQAMEETGFLKFGGDVSISQFNFAGLGATGGGVPGENFAQKYGDNVNGIRMGIRAQIQHLKAYASTDPTSQECVDSRFNYVNPRGKAPTIAGLSGTWATDTGYAPKIVNICNYIK